MAPVANAEYTAAEKFDTELRVKLGDLDQLSYDSLREMARRRLPRGIFEYVDRGTEDEAGLLQNRRRFDEIRLLPNVLVDAASRSQRIELFGQSCSLPLVIAPTAAAGLLWHRGEIHLAKAGAKAGIPYCAATEAITPLEAIASAAKGNIWFQLYFWRDRSLSYGLIDRARAAGIDTLVVTVDAIIPPKREYNARNGFDVPLKPSLRGAWDVATHPQWFTQVLLRYLLSEGMPTHGNYPDGYRAKITRGKPADAVRMDPSLDWGDIAALRRYWRGNLVIKGILSPDDAVKAVSHGRITGVELIPKKIHQYRDAIRYKAFIAHKKELAERQHREAVAFERRQALETLTMERRVRALELVEQRERKSLETALLKERRAEERERTDRAPAPVEPTPTHTDVFNEAAREPIDLTAEFERASGSGDGSGEATGGAVQEAAPEAEITIQRRKRTRDRSQEAERSTQSKHPDRDIDNNDPSPDTPTPRRRRDRDFDRGR